MTHPLVPVVAKLVTGSTDMDSLDIDSQFVFPPSSPGVEEHISEFEQKNAGTKLSDMTPLDNKRKPEGSPENSELSRKEKKLLKSAEKKNKKQEIKKNKTVHVLKKLLNFIFSGYLNPSLHLCQKTI